MLDNGTYVDKGVSGTKIKRDFKNNKGKEQKTIHKMKRSIEKERNCFFGFKK